MGGDGGEAGECAAVVQVKISPLAIQPPLFTSTKLLHAAEAVHSSVSLEGRLETAVLCLDCSRGSRKRSWRRWWRSGKVCFSCLGEDQFVSTVSTILELL